MGGGGNISGGLRSSPRLRANSSSNEVGDAAPSRRRRSRSSSAPRKEEISKTKKKVDIQQRDGDGMTIWWLAIVSITFLFHWEATFRQVIFKMDQVPESVFNTCINWIMSKSLLYESTESNALALFKGVSCASGLCVGFGYYTFKIAFRYVQGSMSRQLYENNNLENVIPFPVFMCIDMGVHVAGVLAVTYYWWQYVTPLAILCAFMFHRMWSYVHSTGKTMFYTEVEKVYGFRKQMPTWSFVMLYASEAIVLGYSMYHTAQVTSA